MSCKPRQFNKFVSFLGIAVGGSVSFAFALIYRGDETFYSKVMMPIVSSLIDPELSHKACLFLTKHKLIRCRDNLTADQANKLRTNVLNITFVNPIGLAAGFDKNSQAVLGLQQYGFGFAEVGTVTPKPQDGNPKKRIFRLLGDKALINRCGFNNHGIESVVTRLSKLNSSKYMVIGLNLGKNKDTDHISSDYLDGLERAHHLESVDYFVINISSPNTPGLRDSQDRKNLERLLGDVLAKMDHLSIKKPLLVKIAPDLNDTQIKDIADVITTKKCGTAKVSGIILTNTTISRPSSNDQSIRDPQYAEMGGLSGPPLRDMSTKVISKFYKLTNGQVPIIGVGGVSSGRDAYEKIRAGASLIQLYTSLTYEGPPIVNRIKRELVELLEDDKLSSIEEAIGLDNRS